MQIFTTIFMTADKRSSPQQYHSIVPLCVINKLLVAINREVVVHLNRNPAPEWQTVCIWLIYVLCWCFICFQPENPWSTRCLSCYQSYCLRHLKLFWQGVAEVFSILILLLWYFKKSRHYHQTLSLTLSLFFLCLLLTICLGTY